MLYCVRCGLCRSALGLSGQGKVAEAIAQMRRYEALGVKPDPPCAVLAMWHFVLGDEKECNRWLVKAEEQKDIEGMVMKVE